MSTIAIASRLDTRQTRRPLKSSLAYRQSVKTYVQFARPVSMCRASGRQGGDCTFGHLAFRGYALSIPSRTPAPLRRVTRDIDSPEKYRAETSFLHSKCRNRSEVQVGATGTYNCRRGECGVKLVARFSNPLRRSRIRPCFRPARGRERGE